MKKLLLAFTCIASLGLSACNRQIGWGSYSFHHVHVQMHGMSEAIHLEIVSWKDDEGGIELKTKNYGTILLGDGTYMMYDVDDCPICGVVSYK